MLRRSRAKSIAAEIVSLLQNAAEEQPVRRRVLVPSLSEWKGAIRNSVAYLIPPVWVLSLIVGSGIPTYP
jgi:hypothetical protein